MCDEKEMIRLERLCDGDTKFDAILRERLAETRMAGWRSVATHVLLVVINPVHGLLYSAYSFFMGIAAAREEAKFQANLAQYWKDFEAKHAQSAKNMERACNEIDEYRRKHGAWVGPAPEL
jgi:hypothetical protein